MTRLKNIIQAFVFAVAAVCVVVAGFVAALPYLLDRATVKDQAVSQLSHWIGTPIKVKGDIEISYFPNVTFRATEVNVGRLWPLQQVAGVFADELYAELNWMPLLMGRVEIGRLILQSPIVTVERQAKPSANDVTAETDPAARHASIVSSEPVLLPFLKRASVDQLILQEGQLLVRHADRMPDHLEHIFARFQITSGEMSAAGKGRFRWRGQEVSFNGTARPQQGNVDSQAADVTLRVNSQGLAGQFVGEVSIFDTARFKGDATFALSNLDNVSTWLGYPLGSGDLMQKLRISGRVSGGPSSVAFDGADVLLDGNRAGGSVSIDYGMQKPQIVGTLAADRLDLSRYIAGGSRGSKSEGGEAAVALVSQNKGVERLLSGLSLDLRVSAAEIAATDVNLGRTAATLSIKDGELTVDIAELTVFEGTAAGRVNYRVSGSTSRMSMTGSLNGVRAEQVLPSLLLDGVVAGHANVDGSLEATGDSPGDMLKTLRGKLKVDMHKGGEVGIGLNALISQASQNSASGWGSVLVERTAFKSLRSDLEFSDGMLKGNEVRLETGARVVTGGGVVYLDRKALDCRLNIQAKSAARSSEKLPADDPANAKAGNDRTRAQSAENHPSKQSIDDSTSLKLVVQGDWDNPHIAERDDTAKLEGRFGPF